MTLSTTQVQAIIRVWADNFLEDIEAVHTNGEYLVNADKIIEYAQAVPYDTAAEILIEVEVEQSPLEMS